MLTKFKWNFIKPKWKVEARISISLSVNIFRIALAIATKRFWNKRSICKSRACSLVAKCVVFSHFFNRLESYRLVSESNVHIASASIVWYWVDINSDKKLPGNCNLNLNGFCKVGRAIYNYSVWFLHSIKLWNNELFWNFVLNQLELWKNNSWILMVMILSCDPIMQ